MAAEPRKQNRKWVTHWQNSTLNARTNGDEFTAINRSRSNVYRERGVAPSDVLYIVSILYGKLLLVGRMVVQQLRDVPVDERGFGADISALAVSGSGSKMHYRRALETKLSRQVAFLSGKGTKPLCFVGDTDRVDPQATRGVREIDDATARLFDDIIAATDDWSMEERARAPEILAVHLRRQRLDAPAQTDVPPNFAEPLDPRPEGQRVQRLVWRIERDPANRKAAIRLHGTRCKACEIDFRERYGPAFDKGFIHIHHLKPLAAAEEAQKPDIVNDLCPLCPNCHAAAHFGRPYDAPRTIADIKAMLQRPPQ
jgi:hypothetical protein